MRANILSTERHAWRRYETENQQILATGDPSTVDAFTDLFSRGAPDRDAIVRVARRQPGHYALALKSPESCFAIVDHCRSSPIFYTDTHVSNDAHLLRSEEDLRQPNQTAIAHASMAGFVTGNQTLSAGMHQLRAGEFALWSASQSAPRIDRHHIYMPTATRTEPEGELIDEMLSVLDGAIARTIEAAAGRPIWVPLSAGLDSRLLLAKFVEHGYDNLQAFTYGPPHNDERRAAQTIAERLSVPWAFYPSRPAAMRRFFVSPDRAAYWRYCDGLSSVPNFQDFLTLFLLDARATLPEDAVIVNGQTGDFITGGHIPATLMQGDTDANGLFEAIVAKHYSLWTSLKTSNRLAALREHVCAELGLEVGDKLERDAAIAHYERFELEERQAKYVVNGQRNYEFLQRDWSLPLWDRAFVDFWQNIPVGFKYRQALFTKALARWNYQGLFRDFTPTVDQWSGLTKAVLVPSRLIRLTFGPKVRDRFLRRMLYFGMYRDQYAPFGYAEFLRSAADLRNPVSLLSRAWLAEHAAEMNAG